MYNSGNFNDKNRWIIKKATVLKKLLPHLATRGTCPPPPPPPPPHPHPPHPPPPGDWRCDEAWREQTLVYPPVMCQQKLIYCTWELNVMLCHRQIRGQFCPWQKSSIFTSWIDNYVEVKIVITRINVNRFNDKVKINIEMTPVYNIDGKTIVKIQTTKRTRMVYMVNTCNIFNCCGPL